MKANGYCVYEEVYKTDIGAALRRLNDQPVRGLYLEQVVKQLLSYLQWKTDIQLD